MKEKEKDLKNFEALKDAYKKYREAKDVYEAQKRLDELLELAEKITRK